MDSTRNSGSIFRRVDNIITSAEDKRSYRGFELNNHMKVLLVSDPATDKSAAAMDVNIGNILTYIKFDKSKHFIYNY